MPDAMPDSMPTRARRSGSGSYRRVAAMAVGAVAAAMLIGQPALGSDARAAGLSGTWSGKYGGTYHGTFTLRWKQSGSQLSGTIALSNARSQLVIKGTVRSGAIRFGTVGTTEITYSGSVSGKSMSGRYHTPGGGGSWSAHKIS
jgi:hypothetical protein